MFQEWRVQLHIWLGPSGLKSSWLVLTPVGSEPSDWSE